MIKRDLAAHIRKPGHVTELDFSNSEHRDFFLSLYGGESQVKEKLPALYRAYLDTIDSEPDMLMSGANRSGNDDFVESANIEEISWTRDGNHLSIRAVTSLPKLALFVDETLQICTNAGEFVDGYTQSASDTYHTVLTLETDFDPSQYQSDILEVNYSSNWAYVTNGKLHSFLSSSDVNREVYINSPCKEIHIYKPSKKVKTNPAPINIIYNRGIKPDNGVDYEFQSTFNPSTGKQKLFLPFSAWVEFKPYDENETKKYEFKEIDITSFTLKVDCMHGVKNYNLTGREDSVKAHFIAQPDVQKTKDNGFTFDLNSDWQTDVPSLRLPIRERVDLYFSVKYKYTITGSTNINEDEIQISSNPIDGVANANNCASVYWLNLLWGCLAQGTQILMADGTEKAIENIKVNEHVMMDANGHTATVTKLCSGVEEDNMINIQMLGGRTLVCTKNHPIFTDHGEMQASELTGNCRLCTKDGGHVTVIGIWESPGTTIYNLILKPDDSSMKSDDGYTMFAEKVLVGDNERQNKFKRIEEIPIENPHRKEVEIKRKMWEEMEG